VSDILFALDEPQYHNARFGECRFRGAALALSGDPIHLIRVFRDESLILEAPVNLPCPEFAFLSASNAAASRFEFTCVVSDGPPYQLWGGDSTTRGSLLFQFDPAKAKDSRLKELGAAVAALPIPRDHLLAQTQGNGDAESYRNSIVSGFFTTEIFLTRAGIDCGKIRSVLDVGCGTGRLLIGWHLSDPRRRTVGIDINADLIAWNNTHLRGLAEWYQFNTEPPVGLESEAFDLIIVSSVFTHLPLAWQRGLAKDMERLLKPEGVALVTFHGTAYVKALLDGEGQELFQNMAYAEGIGGVTGASSFSTFHSARVVADVIRPLKIREVFPMGRTSTGACSWFPMAAWQDVYVIQKG